MSSRRIIDPKESFDCIQKIIPIEDFTGETWNKVFPSIEEVQDDPNCLFTLLKDIDEPLRQSILQQYNEILIYNAAPLPFKNMLAPQLKIDYFSSNKIPVITYPKMRPLLTEKQPLQYDEIIAPLYVGWHCCNENISFFEINEFFSSLPALCSYFGLVEDDIINNFENIGYSKNLGLRVLDYGLCEDELFFG